MSTQQVVRGDVLPLVIVAVVAVLVPPLGLVLTTAMLIVERKHPARQRRWVPVLWLSLLTCALLLGLVIAR